MIPPMTTPLTCISYFQGANANIGGLFNYITCTISSTIIPFIFAVAIVMFLWGVVQLVVNADDAEKKEKGRSFMIWGIIALTVMVGVWGLVKVLGATFNLNTSVLPQVKP